MSGDPEQDYFADGMAEDIITALLSKDWIKIKNRKHLGYRRVQDQF